jgi:hypothetical protein
MMKCTSYSTEIENNFYTELFSTDFRDYDSSVQNAKTDILCDDSDMSFDNWLDYLINSFADDSGLSFDTVKRSLSDEFINDMKNEYEYLKEVISEYDDEDEEIDD